MAALAKCDRPNRNRLAAAEAALRLAFVLAFLPGLALAAGTTNQPKARARR